MFVSCNNIVGFGFCGTFEDTIVRFISKQMQTGLGFCNRCHFSNCF